MNICKENQHFFYIPPNLLVCVWGESKNWNWQIFATFPKLQVKGWGLKIFYRPPTPQNIIEGNGVVFKNFTINNLHF